MYWYFVHINPSVSPQVVAVAMDVFTDVDMFADILNAAARRVAVYILLDEQNAHHFVSMVANCRVNLDTFQVSLCGRVRFKMAAAVSLLSQTQKWLQTSCF